MSLNKDGSNVADVQMDDLQEKDHSQQDPILPRYKSFIHTPLKSHQKSINFPSLKLNLAMLEKNFLMSAHERIISQFKLNKRFIEKELSQLFSTAKKLKKTGKDKPDITIQGIDQLLSQINKIKEQYQVMVKLEDELINTLEQRLFHVKEVSKNIEDQKVLQAYFETRLNRVIEDYFLHSKNFKTAQIFAEETHIEVFSDISIFLETNSICEKLKSLTNSPHCSQTNEEALEAALQWCNTYKTKLQRSGSQLEFALRMLQFIEILKKNDWILATEYAKNNFKKFILVDHSQEQFTSEAVRKEQETLIYQAMGLLGISPQLRHKCDNYRYFTNQQRLIEVQGLFLEEANKLYHISNTPMIENMIQVGVSSLKTVFCNEAAKQLSDELNKTEKHPDKANSLIAAFIPNPSAMTDKKEGEDQQENENKVSQNLNNKTKHLESQCPACDPFMLKHSQKLKFAQQTQTSMKCKISGQVMNDQDPPMWIPLKKQQLSEKEKEEAKKAGTTVESNMNKGYLVCKSTLDSLEEKTIDRKTLDSQKEEVFNLSGSKEEKGDVVVFRCPLTNHMVEKKQVRKIYFC